MEENLFTRVYSLINSLIHPGDAEIHNLFKSQNADCKICPITGLDISMQAKTSKFLSAKGIEWYYTNEPQIFTSKLLLYLHPPKKDLSLKDQFLAIAHNIRNQDSNPRNNVRRSVKKILAEKDTLFDPLPLIDQNKLNQAGLLSGI
jgi:hypothetical protein